MPLKAHFVRSSDTPPETDAIKNNAARNAKIPDAMLIDFTFEECDRYVDCAKKHAAIREKKIIVINRSASARSPDPLFVFLVFYIWFISFNSKYDCVLRFTAMHLPQSPGL